MTLSEILRHCATKDSHHTHVRVGPPHGTFNVGADNYERFFDEYVKAFADGKSVLYFAESPGPEIPIIADIDLRVSRKVLEETQQQPRTDVAALRVLYTEDDVRAIVRGYQKVLREILTDVTDDALTCVLLEKPAYEQMRNGTTYVKNGFHLHFPKLFADRRVQKVYLIPLVQKEIGNLFRARYNVGEEYIDDNCANVHWLMYGSQKPDNEPYVVTNCYSGKNASVVDLSTALDGYRLPNGRTFSADRDDVRLWLPRILSIISYGRERYYYFRANQSVNTPIMDKYAKRREFRKDFERVSVRKLLEEARVLCFMMSEKRADTRGDWLAVGFCLWNISEGDDEGLSIWLSFSERCQSKFDEMECLDTWNTMRPSHYTIGTLKFFAKEDNPVEYADMFRSKEFHLLREAVDGGDNDIAKLMFNDFGNEFVYASVETRSWYRFDGHIWRFDEKGYDLRERISSVIASKLKAVLTAVRKYERTIAVEKKNNINVDSCEKKKNKKTSKNVRRNFGSSVSMDSCHDFSDGDDVGDSNLIMDDDNDSGISVMSDGAVETFPINDVKFFATKKKNLTQLILNCKSATQKNHIMSECVEVFRDEAFVSLLNKDPYLVAFKNGVYDFRADLFRNGKPEDYLSEHLPIDYVDYGSYDHPSVMEVEDFFRKVFPDENVRDYFLDQACQLFIGGNSDKVILFWTGTGNNGKTVTQTLFEKMLGHLAVKFSTTLITGKKSQMGVAAPELARAGNGVRWAVMDEPNQDELINAGILKGLTGNDSYWARDLFERGKSTKEITPLFKLHMICNRLPGIRDADPATWNRIRVIPFESKFVSESKCPETYEERMALKRFPMDKNFNDKMPRMLQPLAWYLIQRWRKFDKNHRVEPDKVRIATKMYKHENDVYKQFIDNCIVEVTNGKLTLNSLCVHFGKWFRDECAGQSAPNRIIVRQRFASFWGEPTGSGGKYWEGIAIKPKDPEDEIMDNAIIVVDEKDSSKKKLVQKRGRGLSGSAYYDAEEEEVVDRKKSNRDINPMLS